MNNLIALMLSGISLLAVAAPKYPVKDIPENLRAGIDAVYREDRLQFRIVSQNRAIEHVHWAVTIFNEREKSHAMEVVGYDKLSKVKYINATVYNGEGNVIKQLKGSEIHDQLSFDGFSLYSDDRMKYIDLSQGSYPYTVEVEYEVEYKYLFFVPPFYVLPGGKVSSQLASYILEYPSSQPDLRPRFALINTDQQPAQKSDDGIESLTWTFSNVLPIKSEPSGPSNSEIIPHILAGPNRFEYEGYVGTMNSWNDFGKWIASLNKGRNVLPDETKSKIRELTAGLKTNEEKIKAVYEYMQNKTRYVSIQLGIGGFQPFEASVVDQVGYGDCKALSNYMVSMLDVAGIKANYTLIYGGREPRNLNVSFPCSQFNHAVVFVPNQADTIWLECTSQTNPFGYMGTFTGDRKALAITNEGAQVVWTPKYKAEVNIQSRTAEVKIDINGNATADVRTLYSGIPYETGHLNFILDNQFDEQKKWIQKNTEIPTFDINSFSMSNHKARIPSAVVKIKLTMNHYATASGKRLFLTPNLMNRSSYQPTRMEERKQKVVRKESYTHYDTIRYRVPEEIYPESLPTPVKIESQFGSYESSFSLDQGSVVYTRKMIVNKGEFPPESYNELVDFYKKVNKADNAKVVFLTKT